MGISEILGMAATAMKLVDDLLELARSNGGSSEDIDELIAKHRAERKSRIDADRANEWPSG